MVLKCWRRILLATIVAWSAPPVAAGMLVSPAAAQSSAATSRPMKLLRLGFAGNKQVPTAAIKQAMTVQVGQTVTRSDLAANFDALVDVYRKANVGAGFKQRLTIPRPGQVLVEYMISEQAPQAAPAPAALRVDKVTFEGNKKIGSEAIASAITLKPGDVVDNSKVSQNLQAIVALYKKANIGATVTPSASYPQPDHAVIDYRITEGRSG